MLNLSSIMLGTHQPKVLADFYENVFAKQPDMQDGSWSGWQVGSCFFNIGEHSEVLGSSKEPQRVIFNLETPEVQAEFDRIREIEGALVIKEPYNPGGPPDILIATIADPDGNYFQLMSPWEDSK